MRPASTKRSAARPGITRGAGLLAITAILAATVGAVVHAAAPPAAAATPAAAPADFCKAWQTEAGKLDSTFLSFHPGSNGSQYEDSDLLPVTAPKEADLVELQRLVRGLKARGTHLVLVVPPSRVLITPETLPAQQRPANIEALRESYRRAIASMASTGAVVPDLLAATLAADMQTQQNFYRRQDVHWRSEGSRLTAAATAQEIRKQVDLSSFPEKKFISRQTGSLPYASRVRDVVKRVCGPAATGRDEIEPVFVTEAQDADASGSSADLLGDSRPAAVLVGTSFSAPSAYNFDGFLSESLSRDVLNIAIFGGGLRTSVLSYLASGEFQAAPPAVLIWEVRSYNLPGSGFVSQLVASLEGGCSAKDALASASVPLDRGQVQLLSLTDAQRAAAPKPRYLDVATGSTGLNLFRLRLNYADFTHEDVLVDQTRSTVGVEHYRFALQPEQLRRLETVSLRPSVTLRGGVSAAICTGTL